MVEDRWVHAAKRLTSIEFSFDPCNISAIVPEVYPGESKMWLNKKDGYRQQNVRQRQKLISIIDYDVCIFEYLQPFWRYSTSKNGLTLKSGYGVLQGH